MSDLYHYSHELLDDAGTRSCYALRILGPGVTCGNSVLVKVQVLDAATMTFEHYGTDVRPPAKLPPRGVAVLRASRTQYDMLLRHVSEVRVMQAHVHRQGHVCIIDAEGDPTFLAGYVPLREGETLQVAELFSGAFMGWSRAAWTIKQCGVPCHTSWYLDMDPSCAEPLKFWDPNVVVAQCADDIPASAQPTDSVLLQASWDSSWWKAVFACRPTHVICLSPPCQPWSTAGSGSGLHSPDGVLIPKAFQLLAAVQVPVVALEEVSGFSSHPHYGLVMRHINDAGYQCVWRRSLQLAEVGPVARKRFFLILRHVSHSDPCPPNLQGIVWRSRAFPSFADVDAYFEHLPEPVLSPCLLSPQVLDLYLDPALFPASRTGRARPSPATYRVRSPSEQAECFMASYHKQHKLPPALLCTKGLLCSLISSSHGPRFYAAPEIACAHGAAELHFVAVNDEDAMRHLGNCLAVPQATLVLALALSCFSRLPAVDPVAAVDLSCDSVLTASASHLVPMQRGWLICSDRALVQVLGSSALRCQSVQASLDLPHRHYCLAAFLPDSLRLEPDGLVLIDEGIPLRAVVECLGLQDCVVQQETEVVAVQLCDSGQGHVLLACHDTKPARPGQIVRILGPRHVLCIAAGQACTYCQLAAALWLMCAGEFRASACFDMFGGRISQLPAIPCVIVATDVADSVLTDSLQVSRSALEACACVSADAVIALVVHGGHAEDWWLSWPGHLLAALGAAWSFDNFPTPPNEYMTITVVPALDAFRLSVPDFPAWFRVLMFLGVLCHDDAEARRCHEARILVEIQVGCRTIYQGLLPARTTFAYLEGLWRLASEVMCLPPGARVLSGPHPVAVATSLGALLAGSSKYHRRHVTGNLLLTVCPSIIGGGGTKEDVQSALRSKIAQVCLEQGCALQEVTRAVNQLVAKAGLAKLQKVLRLETLPDQWLHLQTLFRTQGVRAPVTDAAADRAAKRIQAAARRKKLFHCTKYSDVTRRHPEII